MYRLRFLIVLGIALLLAGCGHGSATPTTTAAPKAALAPPPSMPTPRAAASCHSVKGLPDKACTPGAVQQGVTAAMICAPGYTTKSVRPDAAYTTKLKNIQLPEYGMALTAAQVEEDHLISLELAGDPTSPLNLWPEPRVGTAGQLASDKDQVENAAHKAVCDGKITLQDAQQSIASDWISFGARLKTTGSFTVANPNAPDEDDNG